jgi:hypothetical protein
VESVGGNVTQTQLPPFAAPSTASLGQVRSTLPHALPEKDLLPDLEPLPASNLALDRVESTDRLSFDSAVWNRSGQSLDIRATRQPAGSMKAFQVVRAPSKGRLAYPVGLLHYDTRDGHNHWHYVGFATYTLIDKEVNAVGRAAKQGFCIEPSVPIDVANGPALLGPELFDGWCGVEPSISTRMLLPVGWADLYDTSVAGQFIDISDIPNGK